MQKNASITIMISNGFRADPLCTPTLISNYLLTPIFNLTAVVSTAYIDLMTSTIHFSNFKYIYHIFTIKKYNYAKYSEKYILINTM